MSVIKISNNIKSQQKEKKCEETIKGRAYISKSQITFFLNA